MTPGRPRVAEPLDHLAGGLVGERDDEDLVGRHDVGRDGVGGPPADDAGLARSGAGQDRHGSAGREDGLALGVVQVVEQPRRIRGGHRPSMDRAPAHPGLTAHRPERRSFVLLLHKSRWYARARRARLGARGAGRSWQEGPGLSEDFFPAVTEPIRFAGLDSPDPLVVQGVRRRTGSSSASAWRSTSGSASACGTRSPGRAPTCSDSARSTAPGSAPPTRWPARGARLAAAFEFLEKLGVPYYCFHDRDVAPEGATFAESTANLDAIVDEAAATPGADGRAPPVGHGQSLQPPALRGRSRDQPGPRGLRLRRGAGDPHDGRDPAAGRHELHAVGRPRRLRDPAQHGPRRGRAGSSRGSCTSSPSTSTRSASRARS